MEKYITIGIIALSYIIEITPIKINPLSWLGSVFNKNLSNKIDNMQNQISDLSFSQDQMEIDTIRHRIIAVECLIRKGEKLKRWQFDSVFKDIDKWQGYHNKYPELNGIINVAIENIKDAYKNAKFDN